MRHWRSIVILLLVGFGAVMRAQADPQSAIRIGKEALASLNKAKESTNAGNVALKVPTLEGSLRNARGARVALQEEQVKLSPDSADLTPVRQAITDLDAAITVAETQQKKDIQDALMQSLESLKTTKGAAETAANASNLIPDRQEFGERIAAIIRLGAELRPKIAAARALLDLAPQYKPTDLAEVATFQKSVDDLRSEVRDAGRVAETVRQRTSGDGSRYVTDTIRLYFFQNSEHMLRNLVNQDRTVYRENDQKLRDAEAALVAAREASRAASDEFTRLQVERVTKNETLQGSQKAIEDAQIILAQARLAEATSQAKLTAASRKKVQVTRAKDDDTKDQTDKTARRDAAKKALDDFNTANPNLPADDPKQKDLKRLQDVANAAEKDKTQADRKVTDAIRAEEDATKAETDATTQHTAAQGKVTTAETTLNAAETDKDSLKGRLKTAETEFGTAAVNALNASLNANRRASDLADTRSEFKNTPAPLVAVENPFSSDPVDRVRIQADAGSTLMLRGNRADVDQAIRIIRDRDRPGAQVRAVFWTIQVNGANTRKDARGLKNAIEDINDQMMLARGQVALSGATLRDAIAYEYLSYSYQPGDRERAKMQDPGVGYSRQLGTSPDLRDLFFQPEVVKILKLGKGIDGRERALHPMNLATYGEAGVVLALARRDHRENIIRNFLQWLPGRLATLEVEYLVERGKLKSDDVGAKTEELARKYAQTAQFLRLRNYFQYEIHNQLADLLPEPRIKHNTERILFKDLELQQDQSPAQQEAIKFWAGVKPGAWLKIDAQLLSIEHATAGRLDSFASSDFDDPEHPQYALIQERKQLNLLLGLPAKDTSPLTAYKDQLGSLHQQYEKFAGELEFEGLYPEEGKDAIGARLFRRQQYRRLADGGGALDHRARVAAMDAVIRRLMQATEADLEQQFVNPTLHNIQAAAAKRGVTLGTIERNGVIAINRTPARVDPKATFEIQLPPKVNFLKEIKNAATLAAAVQSGGFTAFLPQLEATRPSTLDDLPGTYYIENGNAVEFTPVVGPDGQAIRMQVRYRRDNPVRLPNREIGQNFGKIERHNIDTDVQDTNFELIEIARFENQTTVGENRQRKGGIPILNQIPGIQELPFIGYFTRERERVIGNQESLVFLQTSIYPSIEDLIGLFSESEVNNPN